MPSPRRLRGRWAGLSAAVACVLALGAGGTAVADIIIDASPPTHGQKRAYFLLTAKHSDLNLNVPAASTQNGTQIIQWDGKDFMNAHWEEVWTSYGFSIRNRWSRQCLAVDSKADGAPVVQRPCDGSPSQRWWYDQPKGEWLWRHVVNHWSGLDLNVVGASNAPGAKGDAVPPRSGRGELAVPPELRVLRRRVAPPVASCSGRSRASPRPVRHPERGRPVKGFAWGTCRTSSRSRHIGPATPTRLPAGSVK